MALLRVDPGLVIWLWITFGIVLLVLRLTAWDKITGALDRRSDRIVSDLEQARRAAEKGAALLAEYERTLGEGRTEAAQIIENARAEASQLREDLLRRTQEEVRDLRERARADIERAREDAERGMRGELVSLSFTVADALLRRETTSEDNRAFVDELAGRLIAGRPGSPPV